jgi:hypothetical protein
MTSMTARSYYLSFRPPYVISAAAAQAAFVARAVQYTIVLVFGVKADFPPFPG